MKTFKIKSCRECPFRQDLDCAFFPNKLDESMLDDLNMSCDIADGVCFIGDVEGYDDEADEQELKQREN